MRNLLSRALLGLLGLLAATCPTGVLADSIIHSLSTSATSPLPASSCFVVDQASTTDAKLCGAGNTATFSAAIGSLAASNNLSDLVTPATARTNLGLGTSATVNTGTSGATIPLLNANNTWAGSNTFNGAIAGTGITNYFSAPSAIGNTTPSSGAFTTLSATGAVNFTGLGSTAQTSCLGLDASNNVVKATGACTVTAGTLSVTDVTHTVASTTTETFGPGFVVGGTSPSATVNLAKPDTTVTTSTTLTSAYNNGMYNYNGASLTATIPAISSTFLPASTVNGVTAGYGVILNNFNATNLTISSTSTVNGCGTTLYSGGFYHYVSNGTSLDCYGFPGFGAILAANNSFSGANTFTGTVIGSSLSLTSSSNLSSTACGKTVHFNSGTSATLTALNSLPADCNFAVDQTGTAKATISGTGASGQATLHTACSVAGTRAQYSVIWIHTESNVGGSAAVVNVSGDCG
jgi:hypothetical protein